MDNFYFKYLTPSNDDKRWGLFINVAGFAHVAQNETYPPLGHPAGYNFNWKNGRILHEFQLNYITEGSGILETEYGKYQVQPGTVIFIFPGMWHRYKPHKSGWKEHYIGFLGSFTDNLFLDKTISPQKPVVYIGFQDNIIKHFFEILDQIKDEKPGYQQVCSSIILYIVSSIISINKNREFSGREVEKKIRKACITLRENVNKSINIQQLAHDYHIGYSHFRKMFKKYTGLSPAQYHLNLRIQRANELLMSTNLSVKQIAFELGFQSNFYFTRIYTRKTGLTPSSVRKNNK